MSKLTEQLKKIKECKLEIKIIQTPYPMVQTLDLKILDKTNKTVFVFPLMQRKEIIIEGLSLDIKKLKWE